MDVVQKASRSTNQMMGHGWPWLIDGHGSFAQKKSPIFWVQGRQDTGAATGFAVSNARLGAVGSAVCK